MASIKHKYDDGQVFEVYGTRTKTTREFEDDHEWNETTIYFLIWNSGWQWVDSSSYRPA